MTVSQTATTLAERMKRSRLFAGLDQAEMADAIGTTRNSVSAWERGVNEPGAFKLALWSLVVERDLEWLLWGDERPASAEAGLELVRPKGLEPPTF